MLRVYACLTTQHDSMLLFVAAGICLLSSATAFALAARVCAMAAPRRLRWLPLLAVITGAGIWSTHFIAMLAYQPGLPTGYAPRATLLSIIVAVFSGAIAWRSVCSPRPSRWAAGGALLAIGIGAMHFTGMAALKTTGRITYSPSLVFVAMALGTMLVVGATVDFRRRARALPLLPALLFTLAVCTIHFGSMAAATIVPDPRIPIPAAVIRPGDLTMVIATVAIAIMLVAMAITLFEARITRIATGELDRLKSFAESATEGLALLDGSTLVDANATFWSIAGYDPATPPRDLPLDRLLPARWTSSPSTGGGAGHGEFEETELRTASGTAIAVEAMMRPTEIDGVLRQMVLVRDISQRKAAAAKIAHLALHDALTGAANRTAMRTALARALAAASPERPVAILCLSLDRFRSVNDRFGHVVGDSVLVEFARRVRNCLNQGDVLARLGGDEFVVIQLGGDQPKAAGALAERIIDHVGRDIHFGNVVLRVGTSIGVAVDLSNVADAETLLGKAERALHRAKADGRGVVRFFDAAMDQQLLERHQLEADLRAAIVTDALHLNYQPQLCLETGEIVGFEALVRWHHPERGLVPPDVFIPLAEEAGLISAIDTWVLRQACSEAAGWTRPLRIAVNLSPAQFAQGNLVATIAVILAESGLDPRRLDLEVTEGLLIDNPAKALATLRQLKALGIRIAMDDFGTGYSSLAYFRDFPFDKVKIDKTFVRDLSERREALAIVKAIIGLARGLDMLVIAEGVETPEQKDLLLREGCHQIQGYLISRPAMIVNFAGVVRDGDGDGDGPARHRAAVRPDKVRAGRRSAA